MFGAIFFPPATPEKRCLIRFTLNCGLSRDDLDRIIQVCADIREEVGMAEWRSTKRKKAAVSADAARPEKLQQSVLSDGRLFIHGRHDWQVYGESGPGVPLGPARDGAAAALDDHSAKRQAKPRADAGSLS